MAQAALDPRGGESPPVTTRMLSGDLDRLTRLAERHGVRRGEMTRILLKFALDALEQAEQDVAGRRRQWDAGRAAVLAEADQALAGLKDSASRMAVLGGDEEGPGG